MARIKLPKHLDHKAILKKRSETVLEGSRRRPHTVNELAEHFHTHASNISAILRAAGDKQILARKSKYTRPGTTVRPLSRNAPEAIKRNWGRIKTATPKRLAELLTNPSSEARALIGRVESGELSELNMRQVGIIFGAKPDSISEAQALAEASPGDYPHIFRLPMLPSGKVDAKRFLTSYKSELRDVVPVRVATQVFARRHNLNIHAGLPSDLKYLPKRKHVLSLGGFSKPDFEGAVHSADSVHGNKGNVGAIVRYWANDPNNPAFKRVMPAILHRNLLESLRDGRFFAPDSLLTRRKTKKVESHRRALVRTNGEWTKQRYGVKPDEWLRHDRRALDFLGIDPLTKIRLNGTPPEAVIDTMTHNTRISLGQTIADLIDSGRVPADLPLASQGRKTAAYSTLSRLLVQRSDAPEVLSIATLLAKQAGDASAAGMAKQKLSLIETAAKRLKAESEPKETEAAPVEIPKPSARDLKRISVLQGSVAELERDLRVLRVKPSMHDALAEKYSAALQSRAKGVAGQDAGQRLQISPTESHIISELVAKRRELDGVKARFNIE